MNPDQMYALAKLRMVETEARAHHARTIAGGPPTAITHRLRMRLRRVRLRRGAAPPLAAPVKQSVS